MAPDHLDLTVDLLALLGDYAHLEHPQIAASLAAMADLFDAPRGTAAASSGPP